MKSKIEEFKKEYYPVYLRDKINDFIIKLRDIREEIKKHKQFVYSTEGAYVDDVTVYLRDELWKIQESVIVEELEYWKSKLKRFAGTQGYLPVREEEFNLDILKTVPVSTFYDFDKIHHTPTGFQCICPFHSETTPSFTYYKDNNSYFCFGCSEAGDVIAFVQKINNISFREACKLINTLV